MIGNPLVDSASAGPAKQEQPVQTVRLVSNVPPSQISGLQDFLSVFNGEEVIAEPVHFRHVIQRRAKRALGGKFAQGLTTEVTENIEVNPNQDLFGLRRWLGYVRNDPGNVMLLQASKIKEEPLAAPLIFSEMLRTGRPILVTGPDPASKDQLLAPVDLQFQQVPLPVAQNHSLKLMLLARVHRRKGFASSLRGLMELDFLPRPVQDKVSRIATGGDPSDLSEAEIINLGLLADLVSRYEPAIGQFRHAVQNNTLQVPQLVSMFELLTADLNLELARELFKDFLAEAEEQDAEIHSKGQLFGHIWRWINAQESRDRSGRLSQFLRSLNNLVIRRRSQVDPLLWKRCHYLGAPHPDEEPLLKRLRPYRESLATWIRQGFEDVSEEVHRRTGTHIHELARLANRAPEELGEEADYVRLRLANQLLPAFRTEGFNTHKLINTGQPAKVPADVGQFVQTYRKTPLTIADLQRIKNQLDFVLAPNEAVTQVLRRSVVEVMVRHARQREETLKEIYILNAVRSLDKYPFHLGEQGLNSIERSCTLFLIPSRLGLELHAHAHSEDSVGLFTGSERNGGLAHLHTDPLTLCRAYAQLVSQRIEDVVKRAVDRKINYFIRTYGENFFGVIYERVVRKNDIPLSQAQLGQILRQRNVLGNLDTKGWRAEDAAAHADPFLTVGLSHTNGKKALALPKALEDFPTEYKQSFQDFRALLNDLKEAAEQDPREENPRRLIWSLFRRGVYNLYRDEGKEVFRKSVYYRYLQELVAAISSENYSLFHREATQEGVQIFLPRQHAHLQVVGERFSFLDAERVVKYRLLTAPVERVDQLDDLSRVFVENLEARFAAPEKEQWVTDLETLFGEIRRCHEVWDRYSRNLTVSFLDRVVGETVMKQLDPDPIQPRHLYFLPDPKKLCLGKATVGQESLPFTKVLRRPELMGNIHKNPQTVSTTIDDFAIEVHKIGRVWEELRTYASIAEDVLDILQSLSHDRAEMGPALNYEKQLRALIRVLGKPVREIKEHDVQALHTIASKARQTLQSLYNSPSPAKQKIANRLQSHLTARRSDTQLAKINFTDAFVLHKEQMRVRQMVQRGEERVQVSKKVEVEMDPSHQTLPLRVREVIRAQEFINRKDFIVFSPEGQKKKQIDYTLESIDTLLTMRGAGVRLYVDTSMLNEDQLHRLATRVKPHNFFDMNDLRPEPLPGMQTSGEVNPLTGLPTGPARPAPRPKQAESRPEPPPPPAEEVYRCAKSPEVAYRYDRERRAYFLEDSDGSFRATPLPVDLGSDVPALILAARKPQSRRPVFHALFGNEVIPPASTGGESGTLCTFRLLDRQVRVVNEGGKPVVRVEAVKGDDFMDTLRTLA